MAKPNITREDVYEAFFQIPQDGGLFTVDLSAEAKDFLKVAAQRDKNKTMAQFVRSAIMEKILRVFSLVK